MRILTSIQREAQKLALVICDADEMGALEFEHRKRGALS